MHSAAQAELLSEFSVECGKEECMLEQCRPREICNRKTFCYLVRTAFFVSSFVNGFWFDYLSWNSGTESSLVKLMPPFPFLIFIVVNLAFNG